MRRREFIKIIGPGSAGLLASLPIWESFSHESTLQPRTWPFLKVLGLGGLGSSIVEQVAGKGMEGAAINVENVQIKYRGLDGGPDLGRAWANAHTKAIERYLMGSDVVVIIAGMGGMMGTGAAPVVARASRGLGAWTIAIVTTPFSFEGKNRWIAASKGIDKLRAIADATILVPNDPVLQFLPPSTTLGTVFEKSKEVMSCAAMALLDFLLPIRSYCIDFGDIKRACSKMGTFRIGIGSPGPGGFEGAWPKRGQKISYTRCSSGGKSTGSEPWNWTGSKP